MVPLFIDWNAYRSFFEDEAERLIGQPVTIAGDIEARLLPVPTVTFNDVRVGRADGEEMLRVERFAARVELLPFLSGDIAVSGLELDRPWLKIAIDDDGRVDWFGTPARRAGLDAEAVSVEDVTITDGAIEVVDGSTGASFQLVGINTDRVEAPSLQGPWRIEGNLACQAAAFCGDGLPVRFRLSTSRPDEAGLVRLTATLETTATEMAGTLFADGMLDFAERSVSYAGTFRFDKRDEAAPPPEGGQGAAPGLAWQLAGSFQLDNTGVELPEFTFAPRDARVVIDGGGAVSFGANARFAANVTTRQVDLDTLIGGGPGEPVAVADAIAGIFNGLRETARPPVSGELHVAIPSVVVSRTIITDVDFTLVADASADSWSITDLVLDLPGETALELGGRLSIGAAFGFTGSVRLASANPAVFAAWWQGPEAPRSRLAPFDVGMQVDVAPGRIDVGELSATIGESFAGGAFTWTDATEEGGVRRLEADIAAETFDLDQLTALGELLFGDIAASDVLADEYVVRLFADELISGDLVMADVEVNASLGGDTLIVNAFRVRDLGGATIEVGNGRIDRLSSTMQGNLSATLVADDLDGLAALADALAPDTAFARWFETAAPHLAPANVTLTVEAPAPEGPDLRARVGGTLGATEVEVAAWLTGTLGEWRSEPARLVVNIDSPDTALLFDQLGLSLATPPPAETTIDLAFDGVPSTGMTSTFQIATVGGARLDGAGTLSIAEDFALGFVGGGTLMATDIEPLVAVVFPDWPGLGAGTSVSLTIPVVELGGGQAKVTIASISSIGLQRVAGDLTLTTSGGVPVLDGTLSLEEASLGWLLSLPGGVPLLPADGSRPWSTRPFDPSPLGDLRGLLSLSAARLLIADGLEIAEAELAVSLRPDGGALGLSQGVLAGGAVEGQVNLAIADGTATLTGLLTLDDVSVEPLLWAVEDVPVATGEVDATLTISGTGRSPAGLVAALTGSGTITVDSGTISAMNPDAFRLVLDSVGAGSAPGAAALEALFVGHLDAGPFAFGEAVVPVDIASGLVGLGRTTLAGEGATATARGTVDLNSLTVNSTWEFAADLDGGAAIGGLTPAVRISFTGPLAEPVRTVSVTPLMTYLGTLRVLESERLLAAGLELEMFRRLIARQTADRAAAAAEPDPPEPEDVQPVPDEPDPAPQPLLIPLSP